MSEEPEQRGMSVFDNIRNALQNFQRRRQDLREMRDAQRRYEELKIKFEEALVPHLPGWNKIQEGETKEIYRSQHYEGESLEQLQEDRIISVENIGEKTFKLTVANIHRNNNTLGRTVITVRRGSVTRVEAVFGLQSGDKLFELTDINTGKTTGEPAKIIDITGGPASINALTNSLQLLDGLQAMKKRPSLATADTV